MSETPRKSIPQGFRGRTLATLGLASKIGLSALRKGTGLSSPQRDAEEAEKTATALVDQLGNLKGLVMKFGQMASYLDSTLPPGAQKILSKLQSAAQPIDGGTIVALLEAELGHPVDELFEEFDRTPIAAASIGQVHRARHAGRQVVVKVQYPEIESVLRSDISTVGRLARLMTFMGPTDGGALVAELEARIVEECDYAAEARNQETFRRLLSVDGSARSAGEVKAPKNIVPAVVHERSTGRVLTSEYVDGQRFADFLRDADQPTKNSVGATIFDTCFTCVFHHCLYNADPHPGNYLFMPDGRVAFLDFGCVRAFDTTMIDRWKGLALAFLSGNKARAKEMTILLGLAPDSKKYDWDYHFEILAYLYSPFTSTNYTYSQEYVAKSYDLMIWKNPNKYQTAIPPEWLFLNRLQWGLNSILAMLHANAPWGEMWREALESPTVPQRVTSDGDHGGAGAASSDDARRSGRTPSAPPASPEA